MNCKQWKTFLNKQQMDTVSLLKAKNHSMSWHNCAVGCKLQKYTGKTGKQLSEISNETNSYIMDMLTLEGKRLGMDFYNEFDNNINLSYEKAIELFDQIQKIPMSEVFNLKSKLLKVFL